MLIDIKVVNKLNTSNNTHLAETLNWGGHFLLTDLLILLLLSGCFETLPWEGAPVEIHQHISQTLHVITPAGKSSSGNF